MRKTPRGGVKKGGSMQVRRSPPLKPVVLKLFGSWATFVFQKPFADHKN